MSSDIYPCNSRFFLAHCSTLPENVTSQETPLAEVKEHVDYIR
jgi:hypothetical protein